jgi:5-(carboxyamino)imidazole ribonucleotide synthase
MTHPILPPAMLGIIGGGQLGRMFTMAAKTMGYRVTVLEPEQDCPASTVADVHLCAAYDDQAALNEMAKTCRAVTTEFENVPASSLASLAHHIRVSPSAEAVSIAQDRIKEKHYIRAAGLEVAPYLAIESSKDLDQDLSGCLPGILKLARLGYDGKGQIRVKTPEEAREAFLALGEKSCVLEKMLNLRTEVSVIVARTSKGVVTTFPVAENQHDQGILDVSIVPARISEATSQKARQMALSLAESLDYVGVLGVEMFVLDDDRLLINEIAPRPHNSGHYTLDATASSQFEQQVRTLCGLPPGDSRLLSPVVMINLLGDVWGDSEPDWRDLFASPGVMLHLYGKASARPGRKMGHFNVLAETRDSALETANQLKGILRQKAGLPSQN